MDGGPAGRRAEISVYSTLRSTMKMSHSLVLVVVAGIHAASLAADERADSLDSQTLFQQALGTTGKRLLVSRGPDRDVSVLESLLPEDRTKLVQKCYEIRVELRTANAEPVLLAARLRVEDGSVRDKGSVVLDCLLETPRITLAIADGTD